MSYLARLKQLEAGEIFHHVPDSEPTKPTEPPFDGFVGSIPGANENIFIASGETENANAITSWHWLLHFADREPLEVYCNPDATHAEILERYPDALAAEPIPERTRRTATQAEAAELRALVQAVGKAEQWTADEFEWATAAALDDPDGALACYRALVVEHRIILPIDDDRRTCNQCANLIARRCQAAKLGEIVANRDCEPIRDLPGRCEGYAPGADDPDRRHGRECWPGPIQKGGE